jgi:hypothetical protein
MTMRRIPAALAIAIGLSAIMLPGAVRAQAEEPASTAGEVKKSVKKGTRAIGQGARDTTRAIGHGTRDAAKAIGHGTRDGAKAVGHASRDAASAVGEATRKTWKGVKGAVAGE